MEQHKTENPILELIKQLVALGGTLAIVTAILSTLGFIVLRVNASLLGLSTFLHHSVTDYFYTGSSFFIYTILDALNLIFSISCYWLVFILITITLYILLSEIKATSNYLKNLIERFKLDRLIQYYLFRWICLIITLFVVGYFTYLLLPHSVPEDLLFKELIDTEVSNRAELQNLAQLQLLYKSLVGYFIISGIIGFLIGWFLREPKNASPETKKILWGTSNIFEEPKVEMPIFLLSYDDVSTTNKTTNTNKAIVQFMATGRLIIYVLLVFQLFLISYNYGIYIYPTEFHKVCLKLEEKSQAVIIESDDTWLIKEDSGMYIIFFRAFKQIYILKKEQIIKIAITERENIFNKPDPQHDEQRCSED